MPAHSTNGGGTAKNHREPTTQESRILWQLQTAYLQWTPAPVLSRISLQYNARIFALRRKGWQIASRVEVRDGVKRGSFRLAAPGTFPNPRSASALVSIKPSRLVADEKKPPASYFSGTSEKRGRDSEFETRSLFGNISAQRYPD
jgi:hypothetical protein